MIRNDKKEMMRARGSDFTGRSERQHGRAPTRWWSSDASECTAVSTISSSLMSFVPRMTPSAVTTTLVLESRMRSASDSEEKPPKMTECTAPMRAHLRAARP